MSDTPAPSRRVALVIGNGAYEVATKLTAPRGDAPAMTTLLEGIGFDVIAALDCDYHAFKDRLADFADRLIEASIGVFYYSGHAVARAGYGNHLLPTDADIREPEDLGRVTIPLDDVMKRMQAPGRASLIFLDACHDDPFAGRQGGVASKGVLIGQNGLRSVQHGDLSEVLIAYAADEGRTAEDGARGRLSPFTEALIAHLPTPGLEIRRVMQEVRRTVIDATEGKQQPWCKDKLSADLVLVGAPLPVAGGQAVEEAGNETLRKEVRFWNRWRIWVAVLGLIILGAGAALYAGSLRKWASDVACSTFQTGCNNFATGPIPYEPPPDVETTTNPQTQTEDTTEVCDFALPDCPGYLPPALSANAVALIARIDQMNGADPAIRKAAYTALQSAINGPTLGAIDRAGLVNAVLAGIAPAHYQALTSNGRFNVLSLLAAIPQDTWFSQLSPPCLEGAHQAIAAFDDAIQAGRLALGADTGRFFKQFRTNAGYAPRSQIVVYFQYVGFSAALAQAVADALQTTWNWQGIEPELVDRSDFGRDGTTVNEVRYNPADPTANAAAILMAAELSGKIARPAGSPADMPKISAFGNGVLPIAEDSIEKGHIELWLGN